MKNLFLPSLFKSLLFKVGLLRGPSGPAPVLGKGGRWTPARLGVRWSPVVKGRRFTMGKPALGDDFAGAAGLSIDARPMPTGPGWTLATFGLHGGWVLDGAGRAKETGAAGSSSVACADAGVSDVAVRATARVPAGSPAGALGVLARMSALSVSGSFLNGWLGWVDVSNGALVISERNSGVFTTRASVPATLAHDTDYDLSFRCEGTTLSLSVAGVGSVSYTSAADQANTLCGLYGDTAVGQSLSAFSAFGVRNPAAGGWQPDARPVRWTPKRGD